MFYVLAVSLSSLSASDWLFSAKPPADSQRRPDYERNPKTAPNGIDSPQLVGFHMDMGVETYL